MRNSNPAIGALLLAAALTSPAAAAPLPEFWVNANYGAWMQDHLPPGAIDFSAITRLIHFGLSPRSDGSVDRAANRLDAAHVAATLAAAHAAGRPVSIAVGGWQSRAAFLGAASPANRDRFVGEIVTFIEANGYDGVEINIEPLLVEDSDLYIAFIRALRARIDLISPRPRLAASTFWQPAIFAQLTAEFDEINLTTYNQSGTWAGWVTWHDAATYDGGNRFPTGARRLMPSAHGDVENFVAAGVPRAKLAIGMNFYGRIWRGGEGTDTGGVTRPMQAWTTAPAPPVNRPYSVLQPLYGIREYGTTPNYRWDAGAEAPYLSFDRPGSADDEFVSYDNEAVAHGKVRYVRDHGLGGFFIWELGGGYQPTRPPGERDRLLQAVKEAAYGLPPSLGSMSPSSAAQGAPDTQVTLRGSSFTLSTVARGNGAGRGTGFLSTDEVRATIRASDLAAAGTATVTAFTPGPSGGSTGELAFTVAASSSPPPPPPPSGFLEPFSYPDGLVTNANPASPRSSSWTVVSGSLFASAGQGWTGVPDAVAPNASSSNGTGSKAFRALTQRSDLSSDVTLKLTVGGFPLAGEVFDGAHVLLRYLDAANFYQLTVRRRDGRTAIKKRRGGAWTTFLTPANARPLGQAQNVRALALNLPDGAVAVELYVDGVLLARAVDAASPLTAPGKAGMAGENADFKFDDFAVSGSSAAPPSPAGGLLHPDLIAWAKAGAYLHDVQIDNTTVSGHRLLRFSTAIANRGRGPLELRAVVESDGTTTATQRIFDDHGGYQERFAGTFVFSSHAGHNHFHFADFADYRLHSATAGNAVGPVVASSEKVSFAMFDNAVYDLTLPGAPRSGAYARQELSSLDPQGISVGWADVYDRSLDDQWIDVTGLPNGSYWIEVRVDPRERIAESDEANNTTWVKVILSPSGASTTTEQPSAPPPAGAPQAVELQPSSATVGGPPFTLSVFGQGFSTSSLVEWNGSPRVTTFLSASTLTAAVGAPDIASTGTIQVTVLDPSGRSNALPFSIAASSSAPPPGAAFFDGFDYPDGLVTNENPASPRSPKWTVVSGSLYASGGQGWTGVPDGLAAPNAASSTGNGSALFKALSGPSSLPSDVSLRLTIRGFVAALPSNAYDGAHVYLRYTDVNNFYQVSVNRRDGRAAIKKKRAGIWTTFTTPFFAAPLNTPLAVRAGAVTNPDGSVAIQLTVDGHLIASAVDAASPLTSGGKVAIAGENCDFKFDEFSAAGPGAALAGLVPPQPSPEPISGPVPGPNPWRGDRHRGLPVVFHGLAPGSVVRLLTLAGREIASVIELGGTASWNVATGDGARVGSGLYVYVIISPGGKPERGVLGVLW